MCCRSCKHFGEADKPIAAICHGPQLLTAAGIVGGRSCSCYPAVRPDIEVAGGTYVEASKGYDNVHVDGNLVTAPAWPAHPAWMRAFLEVLGTQIEPDDQGPEAQGPKYLIIIGKQIHHRGAARCVERAAGER